MQAPRLFPCRVASCRAREDFYETVQDSLAVWSAGETPARQPPGRRRYQFLLFSVGLLDAGARVRHSERTIYLRFDFDVFPFTVFFHVRDVLVVHVVVFV